ncbi:YciI family protein [Quadrisphaera sp. KR29]|uniref:YciI family protein n=1 Tax=Quadrisphaera sp. KR29 TaxID=3461391 RepID=UPI0040447625
MAVFVATYTYTPDSELRSAVRSRHRSWLREQPGLLVSGPTDADGAVLVFEAASATEVEQLLDHDPFVTEGGIVAERAVAGWTIVMGSLQDAFPAS